MDKDKCRLCLTETEQCVDIFKDEEFTEMIEILSGIEVQKEDGLPNIACLQCHENVKSAMSLRYTILNSYKVLVKEIDLEREIEEISLVIVKDEVKDEDIQSNSEESNCESETVIRFRRKTIAKAKEPKKRKPVMVDPNLKPEHVEFLKTMKRKDKVACMECGKVTLGMNMKNHLITHNYEPVRCDICGKTSKNAQALCDHINYYHKTTPDRFMCDKCGKGFRVKCLLVKHENKVHGEGTKDFECTVCGKKFFEKIHLKTHVNVTHNKIKSYKCEQCGKGFGRRTQFTTHQLVHTKENRYQCQVCGKGFKLKQTMQTHLKGVHGIEEEKTIFCDICHKGFSNLHGLRAHINSRVHGLEKCEHCSEFITVEFRNVHLKDVHGIES